MQSQLVSIIIPTFNRAHLLGETLESVLSQTYTNWECIIVDDGSTDGTEDVVNGYLKQDKRFKFFNRPDTKPKGANACRNYGFIKSEGEFVNWLDSDDLLHKDFLKIKAKELTTDESLDFCACINSTFVENPKEVVGIDKPSVMHSNDYIEDYLLNGLYFFTSAPLWRRRFLEDKILFDETLHRSQERDFHFRMLTLDPRYKYLEDVLVFKRLEKDSISAKASTSITAQKSVFKYFNGVFNYLTKSNHRNKTKLMAYVFYRQMTNYYNINMLADGFIGRLKIFIKYNKQVFKYLFSLGKLRTHTLKVLMGLFVLLFFNKGYKYFYFPQYDYAIKDE